MDPKRVIEAGYDRIGPRYAAWAGRAEPGAREWFCTAVLARLRPGDAVLELGCGPGTAAAVLAEGRRYTGVDLSETQLEIARTRLHDGTFVRGDLTRLDLADGTFDAVVSFFVFNHVPRSEQAPTFARVFRWLRPGGRFMLSLGAGDTFDEIEPDWLGVPMFFAGFTPEANAASLVEAGFELELSETRTEIEEGHGEATFHWVIARKPEDGS